MATHPGGYEGQGEDMKVCNQIRISKADNSIGMAISFIEVLEEVTGVDSITDKVFTGQDSQKFYNILEAALEQLDNARRALDEISEGIE